jgi:predicted nucleic acid-binding protein
MSDSLIKVVADTNFLFMSVYNPEGKAGEIVDLATDNKLKIFSPDTVKEELERVLKRDLRLPDSEIIIIIGGLPVQWFDQEFYEHSLEETTVKHEPDKPVEALAIVLDCGILSADTDFEGNERLMDIDELLENL